MELKELLATVVDETINENAEKASDALKQYMSLKTREILEGKEEDCEDEKKSKKSEEDCEE